MSVLLQFYPNQLLLISAITLFVTLIALRWFKRRNYPPGPMGLPFVGYLPFLGKAPHLKLRDLSEKYGKVFGVTLGTTYSVIISDYEIAKEVLVHPATLARPVNFLAILPGDGGFGGSSGPEWQEQRRFSIFAMRNLGLGRGVWETLIQEDAAEFVAEVKRWGGKSSDVFGPLSLSHACNNAALLIGRRLKRDKSNPEMKVIQDTMDFIMQYVSAASIPTIEPWIIKYLVYFRIAGYHKLAATLDEFQNIFRKEVTQRLQSKEPLQKLDFIGYYLLELEKLKGSKKKHYFSIDSLIGNMVVLFIAGSDTTMSSLNWLILFMASYPEVQKKIQSELDDVIGRNGQAYWDERNKFPYMMATIMEVERWVAINPLYPPRRATETLVIQGHTIPKGSTITCNSWAIMNDPKYHKSPREFRPERFLSNNGKDVLKLEAYSPFSFGKRNCPGETVAMMTIFLYFSALMQNFRVTPPNGKKITYESTFGAVMHPKQQNLCFKER